MRLALSSAAAPDVAGRDLLEACARRGLAAVELVVGHAHGIGPDTDAAALERFRAACAEAGVEVAAVRLPTLEEAARPEAARLSAALGTPIVVPSAGMIEYERLGRLARRYDAAGGTLLLAHGSDPERARALRRLCERPPASACGLAWDARPDDDALDLVGDAVLAAAGERLRHVRLAGGGPEAVGQEGSGVGALVARLTLAGYRGALAIAPSRERYRVAWANWLGRRGGWGCGSKRQDDGLVRLDTMEPAAPARRGRGRPDPRKEEGS